MKLVPLLKSAPLSKDALRDIGTVEITVNFLQNAQYYVSALFAISSHWLNKHTLRARTIGTCSISVYSNKSNSQKTETAQSQTKLSLGLASSP